ncbi:MAG: cytochrome c oxidase subunit 3 [Acidimicrobiales bacterium]
MSTVALSEVAHASDGDPEVDDAVLAARAPGPAAGGGLVISLGTALVMAADLMMLGAVIAAYFAVKDGSAAWPPRGVSVGTYVPTVVTITAVMSAFSAQWAVYAARRNDPRNVTIGLVLTLVFALAMGNAEWLALTSAGFGISSHAYGTFYFLLYGYHLVHVLVGVPLLGMVAARALSGQFSRQSHETVRATAIFWHSANVVWFIVVTALFLLSRHG